MLEVRGPESEYNICKGSVLRLGSIRAVESVDRLWLPSALTRSESWRTHMAQFQLCASNSLTLRLSPVHDSIYQGLRSLTSYMPERRDQLVEVGINPRSAHVFHVGT